MDEKQTKDWEGILTAKSAFEAEVKKLLEEALLLLAKGEQAAISDAMQIGEGWRHQELGRFSGLVSVVEDLAAFTEKVANETAFLRRRLIRERLGAR